MIISLHNLVFVVKLDHLSTTVWSDIMKNVLQIDLPWLTLRSLFVKEDNQGILYKTMLEEYTLDHVKFQKVRENQSSICS